MARIFKAKAKPLPKPARLSIHDLNSDGHGVAYHQKDTVFVPGALPGEEVSVKFIGWRKKVLEANLQSVLQPSPNRIQPSCSYAEHCGGCDYQHLAHQAQVVAKQQQVLDLLKCNAIACPETVDSPITASPWQYRNRARLAVWRDKHGRPALGFRAASSREVVVIDHCPVLIPELSKLLPDLQSWMAKSGALSSFGHVELLHDGQNTAILLRTIKPLSDSALRDFGALQSLADCDLWLQVGELEPKCVTATRNLEQPPQYAYRLPSFGLTIQYGVRDFTQVNISVNQAMVERAINWLQQVAPKGGFGRILDLFCGVGNFSLPLAQITRELVGIELSESMVTKAQANADRNGIKNALFEVADLSRPEQAGGALTGKYDAILLDPPRSGAKEVLERIEKLSPKALVYVSCNPATLARDLKYVVGQGYRLERFCVLDMFAHTKHIETMVLLLRDQ